MVGRLLITLLLCCHAAAAAVAAPPRKAPDRGLDNLIFVSSGVSGAIVAVDTTTDAIAARFAAPGVPQLSLATGDQGRLVVVTLHPRGIHLFDLRTGRLVRSLDPGFAPTAAQLTADGAHLAAAGPGEIAILDVPRGEIERTLRFDGTPSALVFDKPGALLLIGDARRARIHITDIRGAGAVRTLPLADDASGGAGVVHLARTPGGETAMAVDARGRATLLDLKTQKIVGRIALPGRHARIFPTVNSQYFLVPNLGDRTISIISTWTYAESERLATGTDAAALNTFLADTVLLAFGPQSPGAEVFDLDRRRRLETVPLSGKPLRTVTGAGGTKAYVIFADRDAVAAVDVATLRASTVVDSLGFRPTAIFGSGGLSYCH